MKKGLTFFFFLFLVGVASGFADDKKAPPQACKDEETMVVDYQRGLSELVATVQKESLADFGRAFHRRSALSKLNLSEGIIDIAAECFEQSLKDPSTPKGQSEAYRAKRDAYAKLKEKLVQYRDTLKAKEDDKDAKPLIEKFEVTN